MFTCKPYCGKEFEKESSFKGHQTRTGHNREIGFFWHVHHSDIIAEFCYSYTERIGVIRTVKPENEREIRLKWFSPVQGKLPETLAKIGEKWAKAVTIAHEASRAYYDTPISNPDKMSLRRELDVLQRERDDVRAVLDRETYDAETVLADLHAKEHVGCPWDKNRKTIFPKS